jgi:cytochrome P450
MPVSTAADPHPLLRRLREQSPAYCRGPSSGPAFWYLTRYADVRRVLCDPDIGRQLDRLPACLAGRHYQPDDPLAGLRRNVFNLDPPDHTRLRCLLAPAFSRRAAAAAAMSARSSMSSSAIWRRPGARLTSSRRWRCRCRSGSSPGWLVFRPATRRGCGPGPRRSWTPRTRSAGTAPG